MKTRSFPNKIRCKLVPSPLLFRIILEIQNSSGRGEKGRRDILSGKEENSFWIHDNVTDVENLQEETKCFPELISNYNFMLPYTSKYTR